MSFGTFALLDLASQAPAVQCLLHGLAEAEKVAWLGSRGKLTHALPANPRSQRTVYLFESFVGLRCSFILKDEEFVFFGDNTTFIVRD